MGKQAHPWVFPLTLQVNLWAGEWLWFCIALHAIPVKTPHRDRGREVPAQTKVITISGSGRSGSTLLGLLLSQADSTFNLGQARHLWIAWGENAPCSCGQGLRHCAIYGSLVADLLSASGFTSPQSAHAAGTAFFTDAARAKQWSDQATRQRLREKHASYLGLLQALLAELEKSTGATIFIDGSKTPEMALAFSLLSEVDLHVVNLLRDPRAVACSWYKKSARLVPMWKNMRIWRSRQLRLTGWAPSLPKRFTSLKYEDFAENPRSTITELGAFCGIAGLDHAFLGPNSAALSWNNQHVFPPANETVLSERRAEVRITPAESWKAATNANLHRLAMVATWPTGQKTYPDRL